MKINFTFSFKIMMLFLKPVGGANKKGLCVSCEKNAAALKAWPSPSDEQTDQQSWGFKTQTGVGGTSAESHGPESPE